MATFDTAVVYTLTNGYTGSSDVFAVDSSGTDLQMTATGSGFSPSQYAEWFLTPVDVSPFYRLQTIALGEDYSLDVLNDNGTSSINLQIASTGQYTGQFWRFDAWSGTDGGGYRISNNFTGLNMYIDVYSGTLQPHLDTGDYSGQHWTLNAAHAGYTDVPPGQTFSTTSSQPIATPTASRSTLSSSVEPTSPPSSDSSSGNGTSTSGTGYSSTPVGAIVGGVVGGVAVLVLVAVLIAYLVMKSRRKRQNAHVSTTGVSDAQYYGTNEKDVNRTHGGIGDMTTGYGTVNEGTGWHNHAPAELETGGEQWNPHELPTSGHHG
ncbi:hypothetical protein F5Y16DRAFT_276097 [Xylariaceae sp. FL0255]|nr:hypothetical protein F5Y16DRAFT_276097 [Xylariaceae sp. FL0255]